MDEVNHMLAYGPGWTMSTIRIYGNRADGRAGHIIFSCLTDFETVRIRPTTLQLAFVGL